MELRQLRHFQAIVRASSFGQAAEQLNITQPALSKSMRNLEQSLGCTLLERHHSGVTPTSFGRVFLEYASLVTSELERAVEELNELKGQGKGVVRVGLGASMSKYLLPRAIKLFMDGNAGARVTFKDGLKDELLSLLRRGAIDFMVGSIDMDAVDDDLRQEAVLADRLTVVCDAAHPLAARAGLTLADLAPFQWVLPDTSEAENERLTRAFRAAGLAAPDCAVRTGSSILMASLLKASAFLSYLPKPLIALDPDYAHLMPLAVDPSIRRSGRA